MDRTRVVASLALATAVALPPQTAQAQSLPPNPSQVLAPLAGRHYTPAPGQQNIGFYGTDLGWTFEHEGQMRILFGDTSSSSQGFLISPFNDDTQGVICLQSSGCPAGAAVFPDGPSVDAYVAAHPPAAGELPWQAEGPPVAFRTDFFGNVAGISVNRNGFWPLLMGAGRTPVAGFSNARSGAASAAFGIFFRNVSLQCSGGPFFPSCPDNFVCDGSLGSQFGLPTEDAIPCALGTPFCLPLLSGGFCTDPTVSLNDGTADGRVLSVVHTLEVGAAGRSIHERYATRTWNTRKFYNLAVRAVNDFDPSRVNGIGNDYGPPDGVTTGREKLLIWGRPAFVGTGVNGRDAQLYFAYVDLPNYNALGNFAWSPRYFVETVGGVATFSSDQTQARPLDLSGGADGLPTETSERYDIVDQGTVAFVPGLDKWVMLYGGDVASDLLVDLFSGGHGSLVQRDPDGAIHVRWSLSDDPWGPWSAPQQLLVAGDPATPPVPGTQYGPGGVLFHSDCADATCAPSEVNVPDQGFLYAPNLIDRWTQDRGTWVEVYWNVSTWNPYQVVLLKSRIDK